MHGLFRVRGFTQDDAHIFCTPEQILPEIRTLLDLVEEILNTFGFSTFEVNLSTRPEDSIGSDAVWQRAETALAEALDDKGWPFEVDDGGGAFYGPKIDIKIQVRHPRQQLHKGGVICPRSSPLPVRRAWGTAALAPDLWNITRKHSCACE